MIPEMSTSRIVIILLFAITFAVVGWSAPVLHATYAPADSIVEVHNYEAQDTTTNSDKHYVCFDRSVTEGTSADIVTELYLLDTDGNRIEIDRTTTETYFQEGRTNVIVPRELPDDLQAGEYRYVVVSEIDLVGGQVTRTFEFTSEPFTISEGEKVNPVQPNNCQ